MCIYKQFNNSKAAAIDKVVKRQRRRPRSNAGGRPHRALNIKSHKLIKHRRVLYMAAICLQTLAKNKLFHSPQTLLKSLF